MGVPSRNGDPREHNWEALPHPRQEPTPAETGPRPFRPSPAPVSPPGSWCSRPPVGPRPPVPGEGAAALRTEPGSGSPGNQDWKAGRGLKVGAGL